MNIDTIGTIQKYITDLISLFSWFLNQQLIKTLFMHLLVAITWLLVPRLIRRH